MSVKADLVSGYVDSSGDQFSPEALQQISEQCVGMPIMVEFRHDQPAIGKITGARVVDDRVEIDANLRPSFEAELMALAKEDIPSETYFGPGFIVQETHQEGDVRVIDKLTLLETSMIRQHVDTRVRPIFQISTNEDTDDPTGWPIPSQD
jgi:hypothetical protein